MCAIEMKRYFKRFLLSVSCTLLFFAAQAQNGKVALEDVVTAIKTNRVVDMEKYFDNFVPITINNSQTLYSHNQAVEVLRDFFEKNSPKDFTIVDNGSPDNTSKFVIGTFNTPSGVKYNVYILMKLKGSFMLQDLRFNKE